jgi:glycosyltransferase involved in cell wall biosynthesis
MKTIRTLHVPVDRKNPYQRALGLSLNAMGVRVRRLPLRWNILKLMRGLDVLHIHWTSGVVNNPFWKVAIGYPLLVAQFCALRVSGRRIIWTVHNLEGHESRRPLQNWIGSALIGRFANVVIVHGSNARELVARRFWIRRGKIAVIPHGNFIGLYPEELSRGSARHSLNLVPDKKTVLFLGHIRPYKGVEDLIRAFNAAADSKAVLVIAGRPLNHDYQERIEQLVAGNPRIRFHPGYVADERIQEFMVAADVVVFPYKEILTSGSVLLAMSFGKACVAPKLGCICDVLDDSGAFLYDGSGPAALERSLRDALSSPRRLENMGKHNRAKAQQWGWNRVAEATAQAYLGKFPVFETISPGLEPRDDEVPVAMAGEEDGRFYAP